MGEGPAGYVSAMARLRRSSPDDPGWTRRKAGKGFVYLDHGGTRLATEDADRVKGLVIPPAWQDVWICPWPNGHLQAVGTDDAGRRQYLYHPEWRIRRDAAKHTHVLEFGKVLSKARERVLVDLGTVGMTRDRACAAAVRLLDLGYFRIGNDVYADQHGSFGLTTLQRRHVTRHGRSLEFRFVGKSGVEHTISIEDPATVEALEVMRRRRAPADEELLAWKERGRWHDLDSGHVYRARRERRARDDEGVAQAGRGRGDEGGLGVPREHPRAGPVVVRRPARGRPLRGGPHDRLRRTPQGRLARRAAGRPGAGGAAPAQAGVSPSVRRRTMGSWT
jgi:DNA topoisomerase IB